MTVKRPRPQSSDEENEDKLSEKKRHLEEEEEEEEEGGDDPKNLEKEQEKDILQQETNDDINQEKEEEEEEVRMKETVEEEDDDNDGQLLEEKEGRGDDDEEQEGSAENLEQLEDELLGLEQSENLETPSGGGGGHQSSDSELEDSKEPYGYFTNHSLRRTCATRLYSKGIDEQQIMSVTGHRSTDAVRLYKEISDEQKRHMRQVLQLKNEEDICEREVKSDTESHLADKVDLNENKPVFHFQDCQVTVNMVLL